MKISRLFILWALISTSLLLAGCGSNQTAITTPTYTPTFTSTPDPCAPDNIKVEVDKVHKLMREFDDASLLAANTPRNQISTAISGLQRIRRDAEDQQVPSCLNTLKGKQLLHMNTVINTLIGFMGGADQKTVSQGIETARQQHDEYTLELARLLGVTIVPNATPLILNQTPLATTPLANETSVQGGISVTNPGPAIANLRSLPKLDAKTIGSLEIGQTAQALAQSTDGSWILIDIPSQPGQTAWVYASLVKLSGSQAALPIATPAP